MAHEHFNKWVIKKNVFKDSGIGGVRIKLMLEQNYPRRVSNENIFKILLVLHYYAALMI
jgi:hypothetical protein